MQFFFRKPRPAATVPDAPLEMPRDWLAAVAGGLNPQPLPPFHEPERL